MIMMKERQSDIRMKEIEGNINKEERRRGDLYLDSYLYY